MLGVIDADSIDSVAMYVRVSTDEQDPQRQRNDSRQLLEDIGVDPDSADEYADIDRSGSDDSREGFRELADAVADGQYDLVVMGEVSRLARRNATAARFIDDAVETDCVIGLTDDMIDAIRPDDPMSQFFAKFLSLWYEEERKQTIRRVKSGMRRARSDGKWIGAVPTGFERDDDGRLTIDLEEYVTVVGALERIDAGEPTSRVADDVGINRVTLKNIYDDDERRSWYLSDDPASAVDDDRVADALDGV